MTGACGGQRGSPIYTRAPLPTLRDVGEGQGLNFSVICSDPLALGRAQKCAPTFFSQRNIHAGDLNYGDGDNAEPTLQG